MNFARGLGWLTRWLAPLFLCLIVVPAVAAQSTGTGATAGTLRFAGSKDTPLRTRGGVAVAYVGCSGPPNSRCVGSVRLLPRGQRTRRLVGTAAMAANSVKLNARQFTWVRLKLTPRALRGIARHWLAATIEVTSKGAAGRLTSSAVVGAAGKRAARPNRPRIRTIHQPTEGGETATIKTFSWSIWAPPFSDGHFDLSVTCTSSSSPSDVAWVLDHRPPWGSDVPAELLFPWVRDVM